MLSVESNVAAKNGAAFASESIRKRRSDGAHTGLSRRRRVQCRPTNTINPRSPAAHFAGPQSEAINMSVPSPSVHAFHRRMYRLAFDMSGTKPHYPAAGGAARAASCVTSHEGYCGGWRCLAKQQIDDFAARDLIEIAGRLICEDDCRIRRKCAEQAPPACCSPPESSAG